MKSPWFGLQPLSLSKRNTLKVDLTDFMLNPENTSATFLKQTLQQLQISKQQTNNLLIQNQEILSYELMTTVVRFAYAIVNRDELRVQELTSLLNQEQLSYANLTAGIRKVIPELAVYNITLEWDVLWTNIGVHTYEKSVLNLILRDAVIKMNVPEHTLRSSNADELYKIKSLSQLIKFVFKQSNNSSNTSQKVSESINYIVKKYSNSVGNITSSVKDLLLPAELLLSYVYEQIITESVYLKGYTFPEANIIIVNTGRASLLFSSDYDIVETIFHELTHHAYYLSKDVRKMMYGSTQEAQHDEITAHMAAELGRMWYFPLMSYFLMPTTSASANSADKVIKAFQNRYQKNKLSKEGFLSNVRKTKR